jgi:ABC-type Fe3+-hydroxamate transport system substrate-binding protein
MRYTDQIGNTIELAKVPQRIVSLVPSQTEYLFELGLSERIAGITRFCKHPAPLVQQVTTIGGTKNFDIDKIKSLQPDLIVANKEENHEAGIRELQQYFPVWTSDIYTLQDNYHMMQQLALITNATGKGEAIIDEIKKSVQELEKKNTYERPAVAYFIWRKPYMVAAANTFINHMLGVMGLRNVYEHQVRYPETDAAQLQQLNPDYIFLSSEPYAFGHKHIQEFKEMVPAANVLVVDGEMFSWYGSRLRYAAEYFVSLRQQMQ